MSLNRGRPILAIPGPTVIPERILSGMHRQAVSIYDGELVEMTDLLLEDLKKLARTDGYVAIYQANGHGAWEAALRNTLLPGDKIVVLSNGFFSSRWGMVASSLGIEVTYLDYGMTDHADPVRLEALLKEDTSNDIKAVLAVQTETSSSVRNDPHALRLAIDAANHDALLMLDCIASMGCDPFEMDAWGIDVAVSAGQKGLMMPIGLSFVFFNEKADAARVKTMPGQYFDWTDRAKSKDFYPRWSGSPPVHHMYGLRESLDMILNEEGLPSVWARHQTISGAICAAVDAWGSTGALSLNIKDQDHRAGGVTTVNTARGVGAKIRNWCDVNAGVTLGNSLGFPPAEIEDHFRIGHMGHLNVHMVMGVLGAIETAMQAERISHGPGALSAAAQVLAAHATTGMKTKS